MATSNKFGESNSAGWSKTSGITEIIDERKKETSTITDTVKMLIEFIKAHDERIKLIGDVLSPVMRAERSDEGKPFPAAVMPHEDDAKVVVDLKQCAANLERLSRSLDGFISRLEV